MKNLAKQCVIEGIRNHLYLDDFTDWWGVTLTMKQVVNNEKLDEMGSAQNLRHCMNILNKKVYGNSFKRYGKRIEIMPSLEWSPTNRLHYHLVVKNPVPKRPLFFETLIEKSWRKTKWGYREIYIDYFVDNGWIDYITKETSRNQICWENYHRVS